MRRGHDGSGDKFCTSGCAVRETLDFSTRVQGSGNRAAELAELRKREKEQNIAPDPEIDAFMKANAIQVQAIWSLMLCAGSSTLLKIEREMKGPGQICV